MRLPVSRTRWKNAYSAGVNMMPTSVAMTMPENVVMPMARRLPDPAPPAGFRSPRISPLR